MWKAPFTYRRLSGNTAHNLATNPFSYNLLILSSLGKNSRPCIISCVIKEELTGSSKVVVQLCMKQCNPYIPCKRNDLADRTIQALGGVMTTNRHLKRYSVRTSLWHHLLWLMQGMMTLQALPNSKLSLSSTVTDLVDHGGAITSAHPV